MDAVGTTTRVRAMMELVGAMKPEVQAMKARAATATAPSAALIQAAVGIAASVGFQALCRPMIGSWAREWSVWRSRCSKLSKRMIT